jgi:hypothetical protein
MLALDLQHAAGLVAAVVLCGFGMLRWAILVSVLVVLANVVFHYVEHRISEMP